MSVYEISYSEDVEEDLAEALIVGVEGTDIEQLELESSDKFWTLMQKRRTQKSISRAELERRLNNRK